MGTGTGLFQGADPHIHPKRSADYGWVFLSDEPISGKGAQSLDSAAKPGSGGLVRADTCGTKTVRAAPAAARRGPAGRR